MRAIGTNTPSAGAGAGRAQVQHQERTPASTVQALNAVTDPIISLNWRIDLPKPEMQKDAEVPEPETILAHARSAPPTDSYLIPVVIDQGPAMQGQDRPRHHQVCCGIYGRCDVGFVQRTSFVWWIFGTSRFSDLQFTGVFWPCAFSSKADMEQNFLWPGQRVKYLRINVDNHGMKWGSSQPNDCPNILQAHG